MLEVRDLDLKYGQSQILFGINLDASPGQISGVMGNNGVGKSSLLKAISGRHPLSGGRVSMDGQEIQLRSAFHAARAGIAYVPQGREIFPMLSVLENLETGFACLDKQDRGVPEHIFALFPVLKDMQHRRGGDLSGGQQQQLAIARALIMRPKVLLLDEPTEGIQPNVIQQIGDALFTLKDTGDLAIVLVEQNIDFGYRTCDRFTILERGRVKRVAAKATYEKAMLAQDLAL